MGVTVVLGSGEVVHAEQQPLQVLALDDGVVVDRHDLEDELVEVKAQTGHLVVIEQPVARLLLLLVDDDGLHAIVRVPDLVVVTSRQGQQCERVTALGDAELTVPVLHPLPGLLVVVDRLDGGLQQSSGGCHVLRGLVEFFRFLLRGHSHF